MSADRTAIWWIRRDLRLTDNAALEAALTRAERVLPTFVLDPAILRSANAGPGRVAFMLAGLRALDAELRARGSRLILRQGEPAAELARLADEAGATAVFAEADASPYALTRDRRVAEALPLELWGSASIRPVGQVRKADGQPYVVFTPYGRAWKALPLPGPADLIPAPARLAPTPEALESLALPEAPRLPDPPSFPAGEAEARRRLAAFAGAFDAEVDPAPPIAGYAAGRDRMDSAGSSGLSPYLRWGMLSAREAAVTALHAWHAAAGAAARAGAEAWLGELIWRDFYADVLFHFPHVVDRSFRADYDRVAWSDDTEAFEAWTAGRTGYPVVDAGMRQLAASGWMHNRARMITASFLVKDLLIDWRWGEHHFMRHLLDGDVASNNGGWQWAAGTGTDAAPYFRIFNPVNQGQRHDPSGDYIRRWLPELAALPTRWIHQPWAMPERERRLAGFRLGQDYPAPIVDHRAARERTLAAYKAARERTTPKP